LPHVDRLGREFRRLDALDEVCTLSANYHEALLKAAEEILHQLLGRRCRFGIARASPMLEQSLFHASFVSSFE
jgi:hypothetical protein